MLYLVSIIIVIMCLQTYLIYIGLYNQKQIALNQIKMFKEWKETRPKAL